MARLVGLWCPDPDENDDNDVDEFQTDRDCHQDLYDDEPGWHTQITNQIKTTDQITTFWHCWITINS